MATYLDEQQREDLARAGTNWLWRTEFPTWLLIIAVYATWFGVAANAARLGLPLACVLLTLATTWYLSLQHELMHGHPTRLPWLNALLGAAPLGVWLPYGLYRRWHLAHHEAELTHPGTDPESYFLFASDWRAAGPLLRGLYTVRATMAGRVLLQPIFSIGAIGMHLARQFRAADWRDLPMWLAHLTLLAVLLTWLQVHCGLPAWLMLAGVAYPALSISAIRSYQEHRPAPLHASHAARTVINETGWFWRLLFLNNNYHLVHHDLPAVPWFALGRIYSARAADYRVRNGGFVVRGYGEWLARFAVRAAAPVVHPLYVGTPGAADAAMRAVPARAANAHYAGGQYGDA